jgi:hypothetical protein
MSRIGPLWPRVDESSVLEHAQVLGDRGLREGKLGEHVRAAALGLGRKQADDVHSGRVTKSAGDRRHSLVFRHAGRLSSFIAD